MRRFFGVLSAAALSIYPALSSAEPWAILGPRSLGMGGTGVAVAEGAVAQYWNPAALAQESTNSRFGLQIPVTARAEFTGGVLKNANTLGDLANKFSAIQSAQQNGTALDATTAAAFYEGIAAISDMNEPGKGVLGSVAGGTDFKMGKFAFSVNNFTSVGGSPFVDTKNIGLGSAGSYTGVSFTGANTGAPASSSNQTAATSIAASLGAGGYADLNALTGGAIANAGIANATQLGNALVNFAVGSGANDGQITEAAAQIAANAAAVAPILGSAASGNPYTDNQSNLTVRGGSFTEIAMGYGRPLLLPGLTVGGNVKVIMGMVGYTRFNVLKEDSGSTDALSDYNKNTKTSAQPGLDLAALWRADEMFPFLPFKPRAGITLRNINNPRFSQPSAATANGERSKYSLHGQARMGAAISPFNFWHVAMDLDLTDNLTPVSGYQSRMVGLGTEINVFNRRWINIPLRAGIMKNISESSSKASYTAGFGLNFLHFMLDIGGSISSEQVTIDAGKSEKVPANAAVSAQLGFMF